jgi:hypothetical protein
MDSISDNLLLEDAELDGTYDCLSSVWTRPVSLLLWDALADALASFVCLKSWGL